MDISHGARALVFTIIVALSYATPAQADPAAAKEHFDKASAAYREGRYAEAVDAFLKAYEHDPAPDLIYNVAQAYEKAGELPNALRSYRQYLRLAPQAEDRATVEVRMRNLEKRLQAKGVQQVSVLSTPSGASVVLDGKEVGKTPFTTEIAPGKHELVLSHPDHPDTTKQFVLAPDRSMELDIALGGSSAPAGEPARGAEPLMPPGEPMRDAPPDGPAVRAPTWIALGVGAAALGGALAFELARRGAEDDADASRTQIEHRDHYDRMESRQTTARILAGVGAVAVVAGGVLLAIDLGRDRGPSVAIGCTDGACGIAARGRLP